MILIRSICLFWVVISPPISTAILRRFPTIPEISVMFWSISSSRASLVILKGEVKKEYRSWQPRINFYQSICNIGIANLTLFIQVWQKRSKSVLRQTVDFCYQLLSDLLQVKSIFWLWWLPLMNIMKETCLTFWSKRIFSMTTHHVFILSNVESHKT